MRWGHNYGLCRKCGKFHIHPRGMLGKKHSPETIEKMSEKRKRNNPMHNPESRRKLSKSMKKVCSTPAHRQLMREINIGKKLKPETKDKIRQWMLQHPEIWCGGLSQKEWRKKILASGRGLVRPNKVEKKFKKLFNQNGLPYDYVGDGTIEIGRLNPDFVHTRGVKKVIEVFGDYWHRNDNPQDRIDAFRKYGWDCLVIWEHELKDLPEGEIVNKIKGFTDIQAEVP